MTNLITKSTLYDTLSMVIPGYLFLLCLYVMFKDFSRLNEVDDNRLSSVVIYFTLSYLVGMIIHWVSKILFNRFLRNNDSAITKVKEEVAEEIEKRRELHTTKEEYYQAYYAVLGKSNTAVPILEAHVSFIRSMVIVIVMAIITLLSKGGDSGLLPMCDCCAILLLTLFEVVIVFMLFRKQNEIYRHVFEDEYYLSLQEKG